jgi:hypothetical protein
MKGGGQPFAALSVGSRAVVNRKRYTTALDALRTEVLGHPRQARHWPVAPNHHFNLRSNSSSARSSPRSATGSLSTTSRWQLDKRLRNSNPVRLPGAALRRAVRAFRPSTVPWSQIAMDAENSKSKSVGDRRSMRLHKCTPLTAISHALFEIEATGSTLCP